MLSLKPAGTELTEKNSLGMETYVTMLRLGFWKKLVYLTEVDMGLELCNKFIELEQFDGVIEIAGLKAEDYLELRQKCVRRHLIYHKERLMNSSQNFGDDEKKKIIKELQGIVEAAGDQTYLQWQNFRRFWRLQEMLNNLIQACSTLNSADRLIVR